MPGKIVVAIATCNSLPIAHPVSVAHPGRLPRPLSFSGREMGAWGLTSNKEWPRPSAREA
eukprot:12131449-Karenia_brevis.AAC.1